MCQRKNVGLWHATLFIIFKEDIILYAALSGLLPSGWWYKLLNCHCFSFKLYLRTSGCHCLPVTTPNIFIDFENKFGIPKAPFSEIFLWVTLSNFSTDLRLLSCFRCPEVEFSLVNMTCYLQIFTSSVTATSTDLPKLLIFLMFLSLSRAPILRECCICRF